MENIGYFFFHKAEGNTTEKVAKATEELALMGITSATLDGSVVVITLMRPGLLIGRKGIIIDSLRQYLKQTSKGKITDIQIKEDRLIHNLYSFQIALDDTIFGEI